MNLTDENDDWIEEFRRKTYPWLHPHLEKIGVYGIGITKENQYVCTLPCGEEVFEEVLVDHGWKRNPIACYKTHVDGRESEGSWRLRGVNDTKGLLEKDCCQLHITMFNNTNNPDYVDIYCHQEYDWMVSPLKHLREVDFDAEGGRELAKEFVADHTYLEWYEDS